MGIFFGILLIVLLLAWLYNPNSVNPSPDLPPRPPGQRQPTSHDWKSSTPTYDGTLLFYFLGPTVLIACSTFLILLVLDPELLVAAFQGAEINWFGVFIIIVLPQVVLAILVIAFFKRDSVLRGLWQRLPAATYAYGLGIIGGLMIIGGLIAATYFFFFFDSSVGVPTQEIFGQTIGGGRVNNLGLIAERQNGIIFSFGVAIVGAAIAFFARSRK